MDLIYADVCTWRRTSLSEKAGDVNTFVLSGL